MLKLSKTTSSKKIFDYDCVTLYYGIHNGEKAKKIVPWLDKLINWMLKRGKFNASVASLNNPFLTWGGAEKPIKQNFMKNQPTLGLTV